MSTFSCFLFCDMTMLILIVLLLFPTNNVVDAVCNPLDKDSLLSFANSFPNNNLFNWSSGDQDDCCSWDGVSCDVFGDRVVGLSLPDRGLRGSIPSSLLNLSSLTFIDLSRNFLSGPLPKGLFERRLLFKTIDLSYNRLSGSSLQIDLLPPTLLSLNLSSNHFNGPIDARLPQSLIAFNISNNTFSGPIPSSLCANSPDLVVLDFSLNDFTGGIPNGFGACSKLEVLSLGFNNLMGWIPFDIDGARSLQQLSMPANYLFGQIGENISNLTNLRTLDLFGNIFSGSIPRSIGKLSLLEKLKLHINQLDGTLPPSLMNCTNLRLLNLRVNSLGGTLSDFDFSNFTQLTILDLGENRFEGLLPKTIFTCKSLIALRLATNKLQGEILPDVLELPSLSFLSISNNSFTNIANAFRILGSHQKLTTLLLSKNFFNENIPDGQVSGFNHVKIFGLGGCKLFGQIPSWLSSLTHLALIDLSQNNLNGTIPGWLQMLPNLFYLDLYNNSLTGGFPVELTRLPALSSKQALYHVNSSYTELPMFLAPQNASYLQYNQLAAFPPALYLASNKLSGDIPVEIGNMQSILILDLSRNNFSGTIPGTLSNLTNLEKLDLSHNNLTGQIPASLKSLHFMSSFNVAYNNLQGPIPTGGQFDTFLNETYEGNPGLCGPPTHNPCGNRPPSTTTDSSSRPNKKLITRLILGICFGVGLILGLILGIYIQFNCCFYHRLLHCIAKS